MILRDDLVQLGQALVVHDDGHKVADLREHVDAGGDGVDDLELLVGVGIAGFARTSRSAWLSARVSLKSLSCCWTALVSRLLRRCDRGEGVGVTERED